MCPRFFCVSSLLPEAVGAVGKWEPLFGFHFSTGHISASFSRSSPQSNSSRSGGNVGISRRWRDFQGVVGRMGILLLDFHSFHTPAFPRLARRPASRFILFPFHRPAETKRFRSRFDNVSPVRYAVQQCFA